MGPGDNEVAVVHRDQPAHRNAGEWIEQWEHGLEYGAADILEIDVDAFRAHCGKVAVKSGARWSTQASKPSSSVT
jgi:hypothetical protein